MEEYGEIIERLRNIEAKIDMVCKCLYGDMTKPDPNGLVNRVRRNTEFIQKIERRKKGTWAILVVGLGAVFKFVFDIIKVVITGR